MNNTEQILCPRCGAKLIDRNNVTVYRTHLESESFSINPETKTLDFHFAGTIDQGSFACVICDLDVWDLLEDYEVNY